MALKEHEVEGKLPSREAKQHFISGVKLSTGEQEVLLFVDDMTFLADSRERLESNQRVMSEVFSESELEEDESDEGGRQKGRCEMRIGDIE